MAPPAPTPRLPAIKFRGLLAGSLRLFFSFIYPAYGTINALESGGSADDTQQLMYWLVFSVMTLFESFLWPVLQWVPLYQEIRIAILAWLVLPQFQGATWVYEALLAPAISIGRREASKVPALEKLLNEGANTGRNYGNDSNSYQNRANHLDQSFSSAKSALQAKLESIRSTQDSQSKQKAERAFDRDLSKLSKIGQSSGGIGSSKAY